jgi:hypothetical protein
MYMQRPPERQRLYATLEHWLFAIVVYGGLASAAVVALL